MIVQSLKHSSHPGVAADEARPATFARVPHDHGGQQPSATMEGDAKLADAKAAALKLLLQAEDRETLFLCDRSPAQPAETASKPDNKEAAATDHPLAGLLAYG